MSNLKKLQVLEINLSSAQKALVAELERRWPRGTEVEFFIMHGQVNPSSGTIIRHSSDGRARIRHHQAKEHSRYATRDVHYTCILGFDRR